MKDKSELTFSEIRKPQSAFYNTEVRNLQPATRNPDADLGVIFSAALRAFIKKEPRPEVEARFYPYAGVSSTIRLRQGRVFARVSDILAESPPEVLYALACILVAKLYRRKTPDEQNRIYREYITRPAVLNASEMARRHRGYKITSSPRGRAYDLNEIFASLNERYFAGEIMPLRLSWSQRQTRRVLGHHDHVHDTIIISRTLDDVKVPRFVVEYVLYHEMLHAKHPPQSVEGRTIYHSRQFRADERKFEQFAEALKWLEQMEPPRRRSRPRKRRA